MKQSEASDGIHWSVGTAPAVFVGEPPSCHGMLTLTNHSPERAKVKIRDLELTGLELKRGAIVPPSRLSVRLMPRQRVTVPMSLSVDQDTPPGSYDATLRLADESLPIRVLVLESRLVTATPSRLSVQMPAGGVVERTLVMHNRGNVPYRFGGVALVHLEANDWVGRAAVSTLKKVKESGYGEFLDALTREVVQTMVPPAKVTSEKIALGPGEAAEVRFTITAPRELRKRQAYHGPLDLDGLTLELEIECHAGGGAKRRSER